MMAIYLEEAAEVLYGALQIGTPIPLTVDRIETAADRSVAAGGHGAGVEFLQE